VTVSAYHHVQHDDTHSSSATVFRVCVTADDVHFFDPPSSFVNVLTLIPVDLITTCTFAEFQVTYSDKYRPLLVYCNQSSLTVTSVCHYVHQLISQSCSDGAKLLKSIRLLHDCNNSGSVNQSFYHSFFEAPTSGTCMHAHTHVHAFTLMITERKVPTPQAARLVS